MTCKSTLVLVVVLLLGGCVTPGNFIDKAEDAAMKDKPYWYEAVQALATAGESGAGAETALIVFHRKSAWLGKAIPHCVMDGGEEIESNVSVLQQAEVSGKLGDHDIAGWTPEAAHVRHVRGKKITTTIWKPGNLVAVLDDEHSFLVPGLGMRELREKARDWNSRSEIPGAQSAPESKAAEAAALVLRTGKHERRARVIGQVYSGETIKWRRAAGVMRLEVFAPNGDHGFAAPVHVEPGHTYEVVYHYGQKVWFEVHDSTAVE